MKISASVKVAKVIYLLEVQFQYRINTINVMTVVCSVEERQPIPWPIQSCHQCLPDANDSCRLSMTKTANEGGMALNPCCWGWRGEGEVRKSDRLGRDQDRSCRWSSDQEHLILTRAEIDRPDLHSGAQELLVLVRRLLACGACPQGERY